MVPGQRTARRTLCLSSNFDFFSPLMRLEYLLGSGLKTGDVRQDRQSPPLLSLDFRSSEWEGTGFLLWETYSWWNVPLEVEGGPVAGCHYDFSPRRWWDELKNPEKPGMVVQACDLSTWKVEEGGSKLKASFSQDDSCLRKTKPNQITWCLHQAF